MLLNSLLPEAFKKLKLKTVTQQLRVPTVPPYLVRSSSKKIQAKLYFWQLSICHPAPIMNEATKQREQ